MDSCHLFLLHQFAFLKIKLSDQFISPARKKLIHEHGLLSGESKHQCSFSIADGLKNMLGTFIGAHHLALVHRTLTLLVAAVVECCIADVRSRKSGTNPHYMNTFSCEFGAN